jgi:hypothetical protein
LPVVRGDEAATAVSDFAPLEDLRQQLDYYFSQLGSDMESQEEYNEVRQSRVAKDANTVIVIAQAFAAHQQDTPEKQASAEMVEAAREMVDGASDLEAARAAFEKLKESRMASGDGVSWEPVADLVLLMQQVPVVNNSLRAGVNSRRFERSAERSKGYAATLAAIAHASSLDTSYCAGEEDEQLWKEICLKMRDATADVRRAIEAQDQAKAQQALARVVETCDACHHRFRL